MEPAANPAPNSAGGNQELPALLHSPPARWAAEAPTPGDAPEVDAEALSRHVAAGENLLAALPEKRLRTAEQQCTADTVHRGCRRLRRQFLATHARWVYEQLGGDPGSHQSLADLVYAAADTFPGLVPTRTQIAQEASRLQADKEGREIDQGIFFWAMLSPLRGSPKLVEVLRRPTRRAQELLGRYRQQGRLDLGSLKIERQGPAALLTFTNTSSLNAEDNALIDAMETAVDLALLDDGCQVGVLRGGAVDHPRYAGRRVFSAGINLKHLHHGRIAFVDFLLRRELGYLHKMQRGLSVNDPDGFRQDLQKPWLAAVDSFAIGGGAQLLLVCDRVIAARDSYFSLPAAQEGIVPGAANLRLSRLAGGRLARQIILGGRRIAATDREVGLLFDEVVDPEEMDAAIAAAIPALAGPAVLANRRMLALAEEPVELFAHYMAEFALEQAQRMYSADVLAKVGRFAAA